MRLSILGAEFRAIVFADEFQVTDRSSPLLGVSHALPQVFKPLAVRIWPTNPAISRKILDLLPLSPISQMLASD